MTTETHELLKRAAEELLARVHNGATGKETLDGFLAICDRLEGTAGTASLEGRVASLERSLQSLLSGRELTKLVK